MLRCSGLLILLCISLAGPETAQASRQRTLCNVTFNGRADLNAKLREKRARFFAGRGVASVLASSPSGLSLWWFTDPKSRAYPAIACVEKQATLGGGLVLKPGQVDCGAGDAAECNQLREHISRAKF